MNVNDPKYRTLRKKLDEMGYTYTLHPDSYDLANKLLSDQMQALKELNELKRKPKELNNNQNMLIPVLEQQIDRLEAEKKELKNQLQENKNANSSREVDERTIRLQNNVNDLRNKLEQTMEKFSQQRQ